MWGSAINITFCVVKMILHEHEHLHEPDCGNIKYVISYQMATIIDGVSNKTHTHICNVESGDIFNNKINNKCYSIQGFGCNPYFCPFNLHLVPDPWIVVQA